MTITEFRAWIQVTQSSRCNWVIDKVTLENTGTHLYYKGGESGQFIEVTKDGKASIGTYEGAIPHIGEALFKVQHSKQFASQNEALTRLIEHAGLAFLLDFVGIPCYRH